MSVITRVRTMQPASQVCENQLRALLVALGVSETLATPETTVVRPDSVLLTAADSLAASIETSLAVSAILADWGAPHEVIQAAQIHKIAHRSHIEDERIAQHCSRHTAFLCSEYARIFEGNPAEAGRGRLTAHRRVQLFRAAYAAPDLGLILAADAWHNFTRVREQSDVPSHYGDEVRSVVSPFFEMLGLQALREDLEQWLWLSQNAAAERAVDSNRTLFHELEQYIVTHIGPAEPPFTLRYHDFTLRAETIGRSATDLVARAHQVLDVALLTSEETDCYQLLFHLHKLFQPVDGALSDHLHECRLNGLRTLQTSVMTNFSGHRLRINFHISTHGLDPINRWGLAAARFGGSSQDLATAWWTTAQSVAHQIDSARPGELSDILYVFSPQGELFRFYRGATVVDYAYHVHTELAHQCHRFYVNDEAVEPNTALHHLDLIALEHDPFASGPTPVWLAAAHTSKARSSIERFLKRRGVGIDQGQRILDQTQVELETHFGFHMPVHKTADAVAHAARRFKAGRPDDLLTEIASGRVSATQILYPLFAQEVMRQIRLPRGLQVRPHQMHLAQCCRPRVGSRIVGMPSFRHGKISRLRVHLATCSRIQPDRESAVELTWRLQPNRNTVGQLELSAPDGDGLLGDAVRQVYARLPHITLHKVEAQAHQGIARISFFVEATSDAVVEELADDLRALPERHIAEVRRIHLPPSDIESTLRSMDESISARTHNPYSRLPVSAKSMFFGRGHELDRIATWLHAGVSNIWLLGQKRVGKTSLLLHLQQNYLPQQGFLPIFIDWQLLGNLATGNLFFEVASAIYGELQHDPRIGQSEPPLRALFEHQPPVKLIAFLHDLNHRVAPQKLVLLLDEFSRTTDAYLLEKVDRSFFEAWRAVVQSTAPGVHFVTVIQQQTYDALVQHVQHDRNDPSWHLMELGEKIVLKALDDQSVRRLIEWPMRNFLEYTPDSIESVASLTGGNPFLIQAFCFRLATYMAHQDRRQVTNQDVEAVHLEFMLPTESVFSHFLDMIHGIGNQVSQELAHLAQQHATGAVPLAALKARLPSIPEPTLRTILKELSGSDILIALPDQRWRFTSRLFQQWLHLNAV